MQAGRPIAFSSGSVSMSLVEAPPAVAARAGPDLAVFGAVRRGEAVRLAEAGVALLTDQAAGRVQ